MKLSIKILLLTFALLLVAGTQSANAQTDTDLFRSSLISTIQADDITTRTMIPGEPIVITTKNNNQGRDVSVLLSGFDKYLEQLSAEELADLQGLELGDIELRKIGPDVYVYYELKLPMMDEGDFFADIYNVIAGFINRFSNKWVAMEIDEVEDFLVDLGERAEATDDEIEEMLDAIDEYRSYSAGLGNDEVEMIANAIADTTKVLMVTNVGSETRFVVSLDAAELDRNIYELSQTVQVPATLDLVSQSSGFAIVKVNSETNLISNVVTISNSPYQESGLTMTSFSYGSVSIKPPTSSVSVFDVAREIVNEMYDENLRDNDDLIDYIEEQMMMSFDDARVEGEEAALKARMTQHRTQFELYWESQSSGNRYDGSYQSGDYKGACKTGDWGKYNVTCRDGEDYWLAYSELPEGNHYCVDSTGAATELDEKPSKSDKSCGQPYGYWSY